MAKKRPAKNNATEPQPPQMASIIKRPDNVRRKRQAGRMGRILRVMRLIQSRGRWDAQAIAAEVGCNVRTVFRDLAALEYAGVPWHFDKVFQCYKVQPDYFFPVPGLTEEEALGQALATAVTKAPGLDVAGGTAPITRKLAVKSGETIRQLMADAERLVSVLDLKLADHSRHHNEIKAIQFALIHRKQLTGLYESPYETGPVKLKLHPYRLCLIKNAWYLIARPTDAQEPQIYRVARFKTLRMVDVSARVPGEFDLREYLGNAWGVFRGSQAYDVEIWFASEVARMVTETVWHHSQKSKSQPGGAVTLTFCVDGLKEIASWLLSWASRFKIIAPEELRELVVMKLKRALEMQDAE